MENSTATAGSANPHSSEQKQAVLKEVCAKWSKLSEQDVSALKGKADLVSQVVAKYGIPQIQAQSEVDALLKGRQLGAGA
ncbi:MAG: hypothetical protein ACRD1R_04705 [Acidobacteriota bacterium]